MNIYTVMSIRNLSTIVARQKAREEELKAITINSENTAKTELDIKIEAKEETKIDNKIDLINPGVELTIKDQNLEANNKKMIYVNIPAKVSQRRRG